ncbi:MAG TPA: sigma-70 family RNA polymerase sigma factor [Ilumatobacteraceae bacterium]|nr:sigma-70 family RNA polymerase sigma factor [Ilumatobacteraceae bacterium]
MTSPPILDAGADGARTVRFTAVASDVWEPLQRYLRRRTHADDVDDVAAETLTVMWRRLDDIPVGAELPWCYSIARRCLANQRRSTARRRRLVDRITGRAEPAPNGDDPAAIVDGADPAMHRALARLSADDRELLTLWAWEQLSVSEIAVALGATPNTVSVRLRRARQRLAEQLDDTGCHIDGGAGHTDDGRTQEMPR